MINKYCKSSEVVQSFSMACNTNEVLSEAFLRVLCGPQAIRPFTHSLQLLTLFEGLTWVEGICGELQQACLAKWQQHCYNSNPFQRTITPSLFLPLCRVVFTMTIAMLMANHCEP